jgi:hypothetical protein
MVTSVRKSASAVVFTISVLAAALVCGAITSSPAQARVVIGFGLGVPAYWGYYPPPGYYYPYPAYYPDPYYYGYPYPYPGGVYFKRPFYRHRYAHWHRRWR